jgi:hypothetical protein
MSYRQRFMSASSCSELVVADNDVITWDEIAEYWLRSDDELSWIVY